MKRYLLLLCACACIQAHGQFAPGPMLYTPTSEAEMLALPVVPSTLAYRTDTDTEWIKLVVGWRKIATYDANGNITVAGIQPRTGTLAALANEVIPAGEIITTSDTNQLFRGNGVTPGGVLIGADGVPNSAKTLLISYTGTWHGPFIAQPANQWFNGSFTASSGVGISSCTINQPHITSLEFTNVQYFGPHVLVNTSSAASISCPALVTVAPTDVAADDPLFLGAPLLTAFSAPLLENYENDRMFRYIGVGCGITSLILPSVKYISMVEVVAGQKLTSLTTWTTTATTEIGTGGVYINGANVQSVTLGLVGTLKHCYGSVTITVTKLPTANIDSILHLLASLDGTNGTTNYAGYSVMLSGGTNGAPTFTGTTNTSAGSNFVGNGFLTTVTWTAHGYSNGDILTISGITGTTALNGTYQITKTGDNTFTYVSAGNGTGAGTATVKKATVGEGYYYKQLLQLRGNTVMTN